MTVRFSLDSSVYEISNGEIRELIHGDAEKYENRPPADLLPSFGDEDDECGDDWPHFCSGCGEVQYVGKSCGRSLCPRDWARWAVRRATMGVSKMEEARKNITNRRSGHSPKFHHVVVSLPGIRFNRDDAEQATFDVVKSLLSDVLGAHGGMLLYHPYRGRSGDDKGEWKRRIGRDSEWSEVSDELVIEEHVHALVVADTIDYYTCEAIENQCGITIHRIEKEPENEDNHVSLYDLHDLARATTYSLSHTNIGDRASLRYFGDVAQTSAGMQTEAQANARVREVANQTLGVSFRDLSCTRELDDDEEKHGATDTRNAGASEPSEPAENDDEDEICGGRLLDIRKAPKFLQNESWNPPHRDELEVEWEKWQEREND